MAFDLPGVEQGSDLETLFKAVGFVVVQWGFAEQSLDLTVAIIFHSYNGHPLVKRRPSMLRPKLDFLSRCFAELPKLKEFQEESVPLLARFAVAGKKRHDLIHGAIGTTSAQDGAYKFLKIDVRPKESHSVRSVSLDQADWPAFRKELMRLGRDGQSFAQRVRDALHNKVED
ncbi:MAG: hypothetical protein JJE16_16750 [Nitrospiraceae bacterium]|nr:hypothetical protein [Nitrospiraceae bacterium]